MNFKAIIFDLDGTLLDTLEDLADSFNYALAENGFQVHPTEAYRYFIGDGARKAVERALPEIARTNETIENVLVTFKSWYAGHYNIKSKPYPGIVDLLARLNQFPVKRAVLSNKPHDFTLSCVRNYFPDTFDWVQGYQEKFPRKPNPASTQFILEQFGLSPGEAVFVGDTATDINTAKNSGLISVGVAWGFRGEQELGQAGADFIIQQPKQLFQI